MSVLKPKNEEIRDLAKQRRQRKKPPKLKDPPKIASFLDIPSVVVRVRGRGERVLLVNVPQSEAGADLVLHLIGAHPDAAALTDDDEFVRFGDIVRVDCPERGEILIEEAKKALPEPAGAFRLIQVRLAMRAETRVGIFNIPDSPRGREVLEEIFEDYRSNDLYAFTLYTTDYGHLTVRELAEANRPPR